MSDRKSAEAPAAAQLSDHDLEEATGGLVPAVTPIVSPVTTPAAAPTQPVSPIAQKGLIGLL